MNKITLACAALLNLGLSLFASNPLSGFNALIALSLFATLLAWCVVDLVGWVREKSGTGE